VLLLFLVLKKALGKPLDEIFSLIEEEPLAAGSLAQVHRAVLKEENLPVALKIRRPDIVKTVEIDLQILEGAAPHLSEHLEFARTYDFVNLVKELKRALLRELNFTLEAISPWKPEICRSSTRIWLVKKMLLFLKFMNPGPGLLF
jgi:ubiquinone biosynthesis protein